MATQYNRQLANMRGQMLRNVGDPIQNMDAVNKRYLGRVIVRKSADETLSNSNTLQNDDELFFPIAANEIWSFQMYVRNYIKPAGDYKFSVTVPAGASGGWQLMNTSGGVAENAFGASLATSVSTDMADVTKIIGVVVNGSTAGNVQYQWSQNAPTVELMKVLANSYIIATKLN